MTGTNGDTTKRDNTAERIIKALGECKGMLTLAAPKAGVTIRTVQRYVKDYPSVAAAVHEAKETMLDFAEAKLYQKINSGNMTAIIFYLKTQGKERGYVERQELTGERGQPIKTEITVVSPKAKELTERAMKGERTA